MADLTINTEDVTSALRSMLEGYEPETQKEQVGRVIETGDGIARVTGLPGTMANELLDFGSGTFGIAMNLDEGEIGAVVMDRVDSVEEGQTVKRTERVLSVPVGDAMLGRVVDPLGRPLDGKGPLDDAQIDGQRPLEVQAPGVVDRQPVEEPLQTGIKVIDVMTPIGRGQRELIIGDRQTGKTAIGIDTIINQKQWWGTENAVKCIYVAVGQKGSTVAQVVDTLEEHGAMEYTTVVNAPASSPAAFQFAAPYSGCAIGANWMDKGEHALIIYDDLSKQADAYRQLSLLLRRPPGREAYPGDVFYLHSRLLERAAKLSDEKGGGSLTALPIVETKANDVSAYIPTNVISITDGQIFLETDLFYQGVRPAMNAGISVSRVGGSAQKPAMKAVAGTVRLELAQYRELEAFAQFGSDLDKASQRQIARGQRVVEILKQGQYQPLEVELQVASVWAVTNGKLDDIPVGDVRRFEKEMHEYLQSRHSDLLEELRDQKLTDEREEQLDSAIGSFKETFEPSEELDETAEENEGWDQMSASDDEDDDTDAVADATQADEGEPAGGPVGQEAEHGAP
ncbi:MAG: F0F1 ATP synthase subunit alpha [Nitriliruptorales bacterium]|nr:F0F1 ATP synthase subunit alpha [Nitriliruptorales bacterium]